MYTPQQIKEAYRKVSPEVREIISSTELNEIVNRIATSQGFSPKQTSTLRSLTDYVLMDLDSEDNLANNIQKELSIEQMSAEKIGNDIKIKIIDNLTGLRNLIEDNEDIEQEQRENSTISAFNAEDISKKIKEIVQKYSLDNEKTKILENLVMSRAIFNLKQDLNVSELVASQIKEELNNRIFKKSEFSKNNDLPMVESGQTAHTISHESFTQSARPAAKSANGISVPRYIPPASEPIIIPESAFAPTPTLAQEMAGLPHQSLADIALTRSPVRDAQPHPEQKATQQQSQSMRQSFISQQSQNLQREKSPEKPSEQNLRVAPDNLPGIEIIPGKTYTTDPYREPLQ